MSSPLVYIVIVNWNGLNDTAHCLESLKMLEYRNWKVILVDNGSTDGSVAFIRGNYPGVVLIENQRNLGFAKGNNRGIEHAIRNRGDYVWLLNNDTLVDPRALTSLVAVGEQDATIGILGSKIYYASDRRRIWFAGARIDWRRGISSHVGLNEIDKGQYNSLKEVERLAGCSMLVKRKVCEEVGVLDEKFFLYVEEIDWCVRARRYGFKSVLVPSSVVYHATSATVPRIGNWWSVYNYYSTRNFLYLTQKTFSHPKKEFLLFQLILRKLLKERVNLLRILYRKVRRANGVTAREFPVLFGIKDFLFHRMGEAPYAFGNASNDEGRPYRNPNEAA